MRVWNRVWVVLSVYAMVAALASGGGVRAALAQGLREVPEAPFSGPFDKNSARCQDGGYDGLMTPSCTQCSGDGCTFGKCTAFTSWKSCSDYGTGWEQCGYISCVWGFCSSPPICGYKKQPTQGEKYTDKLGSPPVYSPGSKVPPA